MKAELSDEILILWDKDYTKAQKYTHQEVVEYLESGFPLIIDVLDSDTQNHFGRYSIYEYHISSRYDGEDESYRQISATEDTDVIRVSFYPPREPRAEFGDDDVELIRNVYNVRFFMPRRITLY